ncbi:tetraspanin-15-like [Hevea brasiliensis]|uniref:tetraspanin-15-like n=1 Tax=Hevea brasiliensis TaxID=3981 RepID=UPI0025FE5598|nr:tetraspanin-15-like [Hevea brasiliensis]
MKDYDCEKLLRLPNLQIRLGIFMIFVFLISNIVVFFRSRFPIPGFFIVMVPLIVIFTMGLALAGMDKMESSRIMATPAWFKEKVRHHDHWRNIKSCIYNNGFCEDLASRSMNLKAYEFSLKKLSSVESGCCNPPKICEMEYVNATFWRKGEEMSENQVQIGDRETWNNKCIYYVMTVRLANKVCGNNGKNGGI